MLLIIRKKILQISDGIDHPDGIVWQLALSLLICWLMCYFCIWKGVKWTGKVNIFLKLDEIFRHLVGDALFIGFGTFGFKILS